MAANRFLQIFFLKSEIIYDRIICSFTISLLYPRTHPLSSLSPFFSICFWFSYKPPQEIINNPLSFLLSMLYPPFLKITALFTFLLWKMSIFRIFQKYFQNSLKIFFNRNTSAYFKNIVVCNEPLISTKKTRQTEVHCQC